MTRKARARAPLRHGLGAGMSVVAAAALGAAIAGPAVATVAAVAVATVWVVALTTHGLAVLRVAAAEQAALAVLEPLRGSEPYPLNPASLAPENALLVCQEIMARRFRRVLELGSGASTILIARALELVGDDAQVVSLEHHERWAAEAARAIDRAGLSRRARVVHAPLVAYPGAPEPWYDLSPLEPDDGPFDLVLVDGPEGGARAPLARYGALPLLRDRLASGAVLLLDDALRKGEREIVARWREEVPGLAVRLEETFNGMWVVELP